MKKRISALLLSVALCLAMLGTAAAAGTPSVSVSGKGGENQVSVTGTNLVPDTTYYMCAVSEDGVLKAIFNVTTDVNGGFSETVTTGTLTTGKSLRVSIPGLDGNEAAQGAGTVSDPGSGSGGGGSGGGGSSSGSKAPSIDKTTGGSVKVSGDGKTVTITPDKGYRVKDVIINGVSMGAITTYTFDKAGRDNTVKVIFEKIDGVQNKFADVSGHWAQDAIAFVVERGLFNGTSETKFSPDAPMTRAMLVTVLHRLAGSPTVTGGTAFPDVPAGQWYTDAVAWASGRGIVNGTGTGFAPNGNITREQLAAMLCRYLQSTGGDVSTRGTLSGYPDAGKVSDWASDAMRWAVGGGIITGTGAGALNPVGNASRAEVATMLMRLVRLLEA